MLDIHSGFKIVLPSNVKFWLIQIRQYNAEYNYSTLKTLKFKNNSFENMEYDFSHNIYLYLSQYNMMSVYICISIYIKTTSYFDESSSEDKFSDVNYLLSVCLFQRGFIHHFHCSIDFLLLSLVSFEHMVGNIFRGHD